jgi:NADH-quinone oxidoreductase subunit L
MSGYYSRDLILTHAGAFVSLAARAGKSRLYYLLFALPAAVTYLTAFYMMRCWMLTFWGKPRNQELYDRAEEAPIMWMPLVVLAVLAAIGGSRLLSISLLLENSIKEGTAYCRMTDPAFNGFGSAWPADAPDATASLTLSQQAHLHGAALVGQYVSWAFLVGIGAAFLCYARGYRVSRIVLKFAPLRWLHTWLYRRMYFDELYYIAFETVLCGLGLFCAFFDRCIIDGAVNAVAGRIRLYRMLLMAAATAGLAGAVILVMCK